MLYCNIVSRKIYNRDMDINIDNNIAMPNGTTD